MHEPFLSVPRVTIHPSKINIYNEPISNRRFNPDRVRFDLTTISNHHNGKMSDVAQRKITRALEYLIFMARAKTLPDTLHGRAFKFRIAFVTLTLPSTQIHSDNVIKAECLNQLLIELKKKWKVNNYVWRAEKQRNGNLHFHLLVDKFIPWSELRDVWNRIVNKLGYVDRYRDELKAWHSGGFKVRKDLLAKWEYKKQIKAYQTGKANDWRSPNSTDIHSVKAVRNILEYISKYVIKDEQGEGLIGRLWGCNVELSNIKGAQLDRDSQVTAAINALINKFNPKIFDSEYFAVITIEFSQLFEAEFQILFKAFSNYLIETFDFHYQLFQCEQPEKLK